MKRLSIPHAPYIEKIGPIKIEAIELIQILKDHKFSVSEKLTIKSRDYEFNSLEDAESNLALLTGKPEIIIQTDNNSFKLLFREGATLRLENTNIDGDLVVFDKITVHLKSFRSPFYFLGSKTVLIIWLVLLVLAVINAYFFNDMSDINENNHAYSLLKRAIFFVSLLGIYISLILNSSQVILKHKRNVLSDIHDKAVSSLMLFLGGAVLFWMATKLGSRP